MTRTTDRPVSEVMERLLRDYRRLREEVVPASNALLAALSKEKIERKSARDNLKRDVERARHRAMLEIRRERDKDGELLYPRVADLNAAIGLRPEVEKLEDDLGMAETLYSSACAAYDVERKKSSLAEEMVKAFTALAKAHSNEIWAERDATRSHP